MHYCKIERMELKLQILKSPIFSDHHYFISHFYSFKNNLVESRFARAFLNHLQCVNKKIPGFGKLFILNFASVSGREKHEPHYEQLVQMLAELVVIGQLAYTYSESRYVFKWEPTAGKNKKNPEISITCESWTVLIEVKCPSFLKHMREAAKNSIQVGARIPGGLDFFNEMSTSGVATRPLDNKVKDYLVSADQKFSSFKLDDPKVHTLLILVWSQHRYEAVSPLVNGFYGLFTENSFYKKDDGTPDEFGSVDGVLVTSHYDMILRGSRDEGLPPGYSNPLDFGNPYDPRYNNPVYVKNPYSNNDEARFLLDAIGAEDYVEGGDPLTAAMDMVFWL